MTLKHHIGVQNVICASTTVDPCETPKLNEQQGEKDTPAIISAFIIGIALAKLATWRVRDRRLKIPIAAILPGSTGGTVVAATARNGERVFHNAPPNERCTPPVNSELCQFGWNSVQFPKHFGFSKRENHNNQNRGNIAAPTVANKYPLPSISSSYHTLPFVRSTVLFIRKEDGNNSISNSIISNT